MLFSTPRLHTEQRGVDVQWGAVQADKCGQGFTKTNLNVCDLSIATSSEVFFSSQSHFHVSLLCIFVSFYCFVAPLADIAAECISCIASLEIGQARYTFPKEVERENNFWSKTTKPNQINTIRKRNQPEKPRILLFISTSSNTDSKEICQVCY